jgi:hypothetical protein
MRSRAVSLDRGHPTSDIKLLTSYATRRKTMDRNLSRRRLLILACAAVLLATLSVAYAQRTRNQSSEGWLLSQASLVKLGAWDRSGGRPHQVTFVVTGPDGKQYRSDKYAAGGEWVYTLFPEDFKTFYGGSAVYSNYSWKCIAEGRVVVSGQFEFGACRSNACSTRR